MALSIITIKTLETPAQGAALREQILASIIDQGRAVVNALTVRSVTPQAADACFGVLARDHGTEWVAQHVLLPDINPECLNTIAEAMQQRVKEES